ncbi:hypothetical protein IFM61606_06402 [Aspergillus udagawae]|nr:hypothetical protein IFM51744_00817 [Aspergillus udagawae]GFG18601.1 hypothetical protein IFM5058_09166 [Aspergillus udagawae]GFG26421.1 hypothetical protein IFM61606_06402 [Aspergillus udagawae]
MELLPLRGDENYIGQDKAMQRVQGNSDSVLDPMLKKISTWSSYLDWSPGGDAACMPDSDYPMTGNPRLPADPFTAGYPGSGNTVQPPLLPIAHGFTSPDLLPTPPLTHILASTGGTNQPSENTSEIDMEAQTSCSCLNSAVFLLDELESTHHDGGPGEQGLDSILSIYQEMLLLCKRMINCDACPRKSENMMVLNMREANGPGDPPVPVAMMEKQPLVLGEFKIERGDYEVMIGMLVIRRLSELGSLLARMKMISSLTRRAHQQARMAPVDQHIKNLFRKLTSVYPLVTEWTVDPNRPVVADSENYLSYRYPLECKSNGPRARGNHDMDSPAMDPGICVSFPVSLSRSQSISSE